ncbi:MAG: NAD(P)/FAD-dependent oxidoreductase [Jatrophihabitans sp.]|uniref:NAD(P)/FAD-dependent oxidoreductase n=1 Tax=Jatrophihabitans sp. TaxID=1932789 RepID=UPI003F7E8A4E
MTRLSSGRRRRRRTGYRPGVTADVVVVGAGPAGATAALAALRAHPGLDVRLVDRADFPRDKPCGDGIAPHALDVLAGLGLEGLFDDRIPVHRLRLVKQGHGAARTTRSPNFVVPREIFDARLVAAALDAGARFERRRVRAVDHLDARVVVLAHGAHPLPGAAPRRGRTAFALRGYAPTPPGRASEQVIVFGDQRQPSYAWSFDRGDGWANVGYGEVLSPARAAPSRALLLGELERLLPGATEDGRAWRGHHLPLSSWRFRPPEGRVLTVGDAAGLINPLTGEGIYYAVLTGAAAGRAAAEALAAGRPQAAGRRYRRAVTPALGVHLVNTAAAARLSTLDVVVDAGVRAAARDQRIFDDFVDLGLGGGTLTPRLGAGLVAGLLRTGS